MRNTNRTRNINVSYSPRLRKYLRHSEYHVEYPNRQLIKIIETKMGNLVKMVKKNPHKIKLIEEKMYIAALELVRDLGTNVLKRPMFLYVIDRYSESMCSDSYSLEEKKKYKDKLKSLLLAPLKCGWMDLNQGKRKYGLSDLTTYEKYIAVQNIIKKIDKKKIRNPYLYRVELEGELKAIGFYITNKEREDLENFMNGGRPELVALILSWHLNSTPETVKKAMKSLRRSYKFHVIEMEPINGCRECKKLQKNPFSGWCQHCVEIVESLDKIN